MSFSHLRQERAILILISTVLPLVIGLVIALASSLNPSILTTRYTGLPTPTLLAIVYFPLFLYDIYVIPFFSLLYVVSGKATKTQMLFFAIGEYALYVWFIAEGWIPWYVNSLFSAVLEYVPSISVVSAMVLLEYWIRHRAASRVMFHLPVKNESG